MNLFDAYVWIRANWKSLGWPVAVLFAVLWWNKTTPCPEAPVTVTQAQTSKSDCTGKGKVVYQTIEVPGEAPRPLPCPSLEFEFSSSGEHWQTQAVTVTPAINPTRHELGVFVGGGYLSTPVATLGGFYGPWRVGALASTAAIGGLATFDLHW